MRFKLVPRVSPHHVGSVVCLCCLMCTCLGVPNWKLIFNTPWVVCTVVWYCRQLQLCGQYFYSPMDGASVDCSLECLAIWDYLGYCGCGVVVYHERWQFVIGMAPVALWVCLVANIHVSLIVLHFS